MAPTSPYAHRVARLLRKGELLTTRGSATAATDPYTRAVAVDISHRRPDPTYLPACLPRLFTPREEGRAGAWGAPHRP